MPVTLEKWNKRGAAPIPPGSVRINSNQGTVGLGEFGSKMRKGDFVELLYFKNGGVHSIVLHKVRKENANTYRVQGVGESSYVRMQSFFAANHILPNLYPAKWESKSRRLTIDVNRYQG